MTRVYPSASGIPEMTDYEPYPVTLAAPPELAASSRPEYGTDDRLRLAWLPAGAEPDETLLDWVGIKLGQGPSGVAKLRQLLNAMVGQAEDTPIAWFDKDTFEWSYDGQTAYAALTPGMEVVIRGKNKKNEAGEVRFRIEAYSPVQKRPAVSPAAPPPPPAPKPSKAAKTFDRVSDDGQWGWDGKAWVAIEQAAPPPPPTASVPPSPAAPASKSKPAGRPVIADREPQLGSARGAVVTDDAEIPF